MEVNYTKLEQIEKAISKLYAEKYELLKEQNNINEPGRYDRYIKAQKSLREPVDNPRIVYQGEPGSSSDIAVHKLLGPDVESKGLTRFEDTFEAIKNGLADYAVLPIENSSTGAIRQVYDLLGKYAFFIVGETAVPVKHCLMALPGTKLEDIKRVYSHEQGLFQCEKFLNEHSEWELVPQPDTAGSAKKIAETKEAGSAAICSYLAAEIYGLEILADNIAYNSQNTTRFVIVSPNLELREGRDKICLSLSTLHKVGSLNDILSFFSANELNLVRLESRPIPEHNWEYMFFIEFMGDLTDPKIEKFMRQLVDMTYKVKVYGNFMSDLTTE